MKTGTIIHWMEIPIMVEYSVYPADPMTQTYPGCDAELSVDIVSAPSEEEIYKLVDKEADAIKMECWEDLEEGEDK